MSSHRVAVLGYDGMSPFELGVVAEVFALPSPDLDVDWWYSFALCAQTPGPLRAVGGFTIEAPHGLRTLARADTIVLPGTADVHNDPPEPVVTALQRAHARGARLVSICSGAFTLAAAGLLDGLTATTHWHHVALLQSCYPRVRVDGAALYVDNGQIITAAGTAAAIDACLHVVRTDHGAHIANRVARRMVIAPHRDGDQAQFIEQPVPESPGDDPVAVAIAHALARIHTPLPITTIARIANLSPRQFDRRFRDATGTSPGRWLIHRRIDASLPLLERDPRGIEDIARAVGFTTPAAYRKQFRERLGVTPSAYRRRFQESPSPGVPR